MIKLSTEKKSDFTENIAKIYDILYQFFGPQHWWPGETPFEIMFGAILTQNTAWKNVEKAIKNLKREKLLGIKALSCVSQNRLARLIRPAGYYNIKARRLKHFIGFLFRESTGDLDRLLARDLDTLRRQLLSVNGVGPETADSILLYAGNKPTFVVDAYTKRILFRHRLMPQETSYDEVRNFFMDSLEPDVAIFNEYHALLVHLGHTFCVRKKPKCTGCPAEGWNDE